MMAQMNNKARVITTAGLLAGLAMAGIPAWAQTNAPAPTDQGSHMMQREMPNGEGMKPGLMMDPEMRQKMSRMMDNCNRMMESMTPNKDGAGPSVPNKS
jgi:Spy/CpxP family protein refolding chaperone